MQRCGTMCMHCGVLWPCMTRVSLAYLPGMFVTCGREDGVVAVYDVRGGLDPAPLFRTQHALRVLHATWVPGVAGWAITLSQDRHAHAYYALL
jgi:hypothetical protein